GTPGAGNFAQAVAGTDGRGGGGAGRGGRCARGSAVTRRARRPGRAYARHPRGGAALADGGEPALRPGQGQQPEPHPGAAAGAGNAAGALCRRAGLRRLAPPRGDPVRSGVRRRLRDACGGQHRHLRGDREPGVRHGGAGRQGGDGAGPQRVRGREGHHGRPGGAGADRKPVPVHPPRRGGRARPRRGCRGGRERAQPGGHPARRVARAGLGAAGRQGGGGRRDVQLPHGAGHSGGVAAAHL
ncbi:MAG: Carbonic anhydrase, beta class, partial [uncultured Gemmatimonadetes bacterium]